MVSPLPTWWSQGPSWATLGSGLLWPSTMGQARKTVTPSSPVLGHRWSLGGLPLSTPALDGSPGSHASA